MVLGQCYASCAGLQAVCSLISHAGGGRGSHSGTRIRPTTHQVTYQDREQRAALDVGHGVGESAEDAEEAAVKLRLQVEGREAGQLQWPVIHCSHLQGLLTYLVWRGTGGKPCN